MSLERGAPNSDGHRLALCASSTPTMDWSSEGQAAMIASTLQQAQDMTRAQYSETIKSTLEMVQLSPVGLIASVTRAACAIVEQNVEFRAATIAAAEAVQIAYAATADPTRGWARSNPSGLGTAPTERVLRTAEAMSNAVQDDTATTADVLESIAQLATAITRMRRETTAVQIATYLGC